MAEKNIANSKSNLWEVMVYLCRLGLERQLIPGIQQPDWQKTDWDEFLDFAKRHRVRPLLNIGVSLVESTADIPDSLIQSLKTYQSGRGHQNLLHARELIQLIKTMRTKGMEVIPYKGVLLAELGYGDLGSREMSDIDFLMNLDDFPIVRDLLMDRGYVPTKRVPEDFEAIFFRQNFQYNFDLYKEEERLFHVEPHWKIGLKQWQTDLNFDDVKRLTVRKDFFGTEINMLTPEGLLITTCLHHGGEDRWRWLKYVCDVAAILTRHKGELNWQLILKEADRFKVTNLILLGIGLAVEVFETSVPQNIRRLINGRKVQIHVRKVIDQAKSGSRFAKVNNYLEHAKFHYSLRKSPVTRLKILYYNLVRIFTPTIYDINDEKSAGKKYWWLFITKPFRIWRMHVKTK